MMRIFLILLFALFALPIFAEESPMFHASGLPVPRFVSLKSDQINVRVGPGERYPIRWVYRKDNLPVEIIEEFGHWRKIRDFEKSEGWVHKNLLSGTRTALILEQRRPLYRAPDASSGELMAVDPLIPGHILECTSGWCRLEFKGHKGWIRRDYIWGVYANESIEED
jgi:SH3-like domain-containing protein